MNRGTVLKAFAVACLPVAVVGANLGLNAATAEKRFENMSAELNAFEGQDESRPYALDCRVSAEPISLPFSESAVGGGLFTEGSEIGGCMDGVFIHYGEWASTDFLNVSLSRGYQSADARADEKLCGSTITQKVLFGLPISTESSYQCYDAQGNEL